MARRLRLQYPGARYHVINRGNLQHDIFATAGAKHAFLVTLGEASVQFGWRANAFVIMRNHYHLAWKRRNRISLKGCTGCNRPSRSG
jgi:putative transposase